MAYWLEYLLKGHGGILVIISVEGAWGILVRISVEGAWWHIG